MNRGVYTFCMCCIMHFLLTVTWKHCWRWCACVHVCVCVCVCVCVWTWTHHYYVFSEQLLHSLAVHPRMVACVAINLLSKRKTHNMNLWICDKDSDLNCDSVHHVSVCTCMWNKHYFHLLNFTFTDWRHERHFPSHTHYHEAHSGSLQLVHTRTCMT